MIVLESLLLPFLTRRLNVAFLLSAMTNGSWQLMASSKIATTMD